MNHFHNLNNNTPNRTIAQCYVNGITQIPLPKTTYTTNLKMTPSPSNGINNNSILNADRWKTKYEDTEKKRKILLNQSEKTNRELQELQKRYDQLYEQHRLTRSDLTEKHGQLEKLKAASKDFYIEYDTLKNKYEVETDAYRKAIQQSSKWYKENNQLKRKSAVLFQRMLQISPQESFLSEFKDVVDNPDTEVSYMTNSHCNCELDDMRKTIRDLSDTVARLQAELNSAKLMEFEANEQTVNLNQELDQERERREKLEKEIERLVAANDHMSRVSKLVASEVANLRDSQQRDRESVVILRNEADSARKERNVLAHQSALLMGDLLSSGDTNDKIFRLFEEVESLKRALEEEKNQHAIDIAELQEKLDSNEAEAQIEVLEEKLHVCETELERTIQRAQQAEAEVELLKRPPIPPPPPPPPFSLTPSSNGSPPPVRLKTVLNSACKQDPVQDMEQLLGIEQHSNQKKPFASPAAIDEVINQIKGGRFTLKATEKVPEQKKPREEPEAVKEMLNVLGTLRRRAKPFRTNLNTAFGDVQL